MFDLRFLNNLKQKLTTGNRGSIYLNALPERYLSRLDVADLDWVSPSLADTFLEYLTTEPEFSLALTPDGRELDEKGKNELQTVLRRLSMITIENNDHFSEHGVKTFGFGFPILLYRDKKDPTRIIKAPMFIWSLDIDRNFRRANEWVITSKDDFPVISNIVLASYLRNDAEIQLLKVYDQLLEDSILDKNEIAQLACEQLQQLHPDFPDTIKDDFTDILCQPVKAIRSKQYLEGLPLQKAEILWSGCFGLFKSQKESIINDLDYFIDNIPALQQQIQASIDQRKIEPKSLMQHSFTVVDADPSQQHLLHLLEKGNNLVIQGPPGTGKSQVLTGIIGNLLANSGTCLVVCEKKTAAEVIYQNLEEAGLGELAVIIDDIYRDRSKVVDSVRERAQKQYPIYKTRPSYLRMLANCITQLEQLQEFHHTQLKTLLEEQTWADLVDDFLNANEIHDKQLLEAVLNLDDFEFVPDEFETILPTFSKAKNLLQPLGTLEQAHNRLHNQFFENTNATQARLDIQRALTTALRSTNIAQETITTSIQQYDEQLETHYTKLYIQKLEFTDDLYYQTRHLIQKTLKNLIQACQDTQQSIQETTTTYNEGLENHFDELYADKIIAIDKTSSLVKAEIYDDVQGSLETIKEAKQDIMACLYEYEELLEKHFEGVYMQKLDLVDNIEGTIEAGLLASKYYFNENKGFFRAIMHGVGSKYKKLEKDKEAVLSNLTTLKKLHSQHKYFKFQFIETKDTALFTFENVLKNIKAYREATNDWHMQQTTIIQKEVKALNSRYSHKAVPYKEQAQEINHRLSDFRTKILRSKLIEIDFKYESLRLRDRFDQLEVIERQVEKIKEGVDDFVRENERTWSESTYNPDLPTVGKTTFRTAYEEMEKAHKQFKYFDYEFIKLGRPKLLEEYYKILRHLKDYRSKVELWYPSRIPIIKEYSNDFKSKGLYPNLTFKAEADALDLVLNSFVEIFNKEQLFGLSFQLEKVLYSEQLEEIKVLESQLDNFDTSLESFLIETNKNWVQRPASDINRAQAITTEEELTNTLERLIEVHRHHNYFDYTFESYTHPRELLTQAFIQQLANYRNWTEQWYSNRQATLNNWVQSLSPEKISPHVPLATEIDKIATELTQFQTEFNDFKHIQQQFEFETKNFWLQKQQLEELEKELITLQSSFEHFEEYYEFRVFFITLNKAQQATYKGLAATQPNDWDAAFTSWYLHAMLQYHQENIPDQENYYNTQKLFQQYTEQFKKLMVSHSLRYWRSLQTQTIQKFHEEKAPIKLHSLYNKRGNTGGRRTSLRKIIATSPELFTSFFPILLVSPSVCSSILPLRPDLFAAVIFDEASQLRLEDTFCALVRGKYKIVSGDSQQMPPSDYFQSNTILIHDEEDVEDEEEMENIALVNESIDFLTTTESLLEYALAEGSYKESFLEVHYRSKHPYLIDFSNAAFYGNRLTPMPTSEDYSVLSGGTGIPMEFIEVNGLYTNYTNPTEATQIIDYLIEIARPHRGKSCPEVGVATFNMHQRNLILEMIQKRAAEDSKASRQLQKLFMNGLFVKNLENIQGDERDILIISTTFGYKEDGSFIQNFGPINRKKGYRLLNVIITRAKQKLCVFTSIPSSYYEGYRKEISAKGNMGKGVFYAYLAYAKAVSQQDEPTRKAILQLLYQHCLKKPVDDRLYQVHNNTFKERVTDFLMEQFPNRVVANYRFAGFEIPLMVKDSNGQPKWAFDFDSFHQYESEEAYAWDLFRETHLNNFGFEYHRIWSKDWWRDIATAQANLVALIEM